MSCPNRHKANKKKTSSWPLFLSFILLFLPKCPFCFVAYTSAITLCGISEQGLGVGESFLVYGLILVIVLMLARNYRGKKTVVAISLVTIGGLFVAAGQSWGLNFMVSYTWVSYLILFAVFMNSGLPILIGSISLRIIASWRKKARIKAKPY